eukprot:42346_1
MGNFIDTKPTESGNSIQHDPPMQVPAKTIKRLYARYDGQHLVTGFIRKCTLYIPSDIYMLIYHFYYADDPYLISCRNKPGIELLNIVTRDLKIIQIENYTDTIYKGVEYQKWDYYCLEDFAATTFQYKYNELPKWILNQNSFPKYNYDVDLTIMTRFGGTFTFGGGCYYDYNYSPHMIIFDKKHIHTANNIVPAYYVNLTKMDYYCDSASVIFDEINNNFYLFGGEYNDTD